jgi:hypothetical protein
MGKSALLERESRQNLVSASNNNEDKMWKAIRKICGHTQLYITQIYTMCTAPNNT